MLMPKRVKRRRQFRGRMKGAAHKGTELAYGQYGLVALEPCWIKSNQIEAAPLYKNPQDENFKAPRPGQVGQITTTTR